jgi:hypothetical protein
MSQNGDRLTPPQGIPARELLKVLTSKSVTAEEAIEELRANVQAAKDGIDRLEGLMGGVMGELGRLEAKVDGLETDVRHALRLASMPPPPPLPPVRAALDSKLDLREVVYAAKDAALRGEALPDTTPEAEVEKVLERAELIRLGRRTQAVINKSLWLAATGAAGLIIDRLLLLLTHH